MFEDKLSLIKTLNPKASVVVLPVLPTRNTAMNNNVGLYNLMARDMLHQCFPDIVLPRMRQFLDKSNHLSTDLSRDEVHLNDRGIAVLVSIIKYNVYQCVLRKRLRTTDSGNGKLNNPAPRPGSLKPA